MTTITSNKAAYVFAGTAVGGAIGYLFFTRSGEQFRESFKGMTSEAIPQKI